MKIQEVAQMLSVSEKTVYRWVREQRIPFYQLNRQYRFDRAEIEAWLRKSRPQSDEQEALPASGREAVQLGELVARGGIYYKVEGNSPEEVLSNAIDLITLPPELSRETATKLVTAREVLMSTALGDGIALPHPRNPAIPEAGKEVLAICFLENPVDFGALDGKEVSTLIFIFSSDIGRHLEIMSKLTHLVRRPGFRELLDRQASRGELIAHLREADESFRALRRFQ